MIVVAQRNDKGMHAMVVFADDELGEDRGDRAVGGGVADVLLARAFMCV